LNEIKCNVIHPRRTSQPNADKKVKYRGMYLQKGAKMLLFAVTIIISYSYEVTFW